MIVESGRQAALEVVAVVGRANAVVAVAVTEEVAVAVLVVGLG